MRPVADFPACNGADDGADNLRLLGRDLYRVLPRQAPTRICASSTGLRETTTVEWLPFEFNSDMPAARQQGRGDALAEALFRAYFEKSRDVGDEAILLDVADEVGLDWRAGAGIPEDRRVALAYRERRGTGS
jgi:DSBA-like thioredoxin domain